MGHGKCGHLMHRWGLTSVPECDCGPYILHIINACSNCKFNGSLEDLANATLNAIE